MKYFAIIMAVMRQSRYAVLLIGTTWIAFTIAVWWQSFDLILTVAKHASLTDTFNFMLTQYGRIISNFTVVAAIYTSLIAFLFGLQITLLVYYVVRARRASRGVGSASAVSVGGVVSGVLGIGCAACGTFVLTSVLALVGAGGLVAWLPFSGQEFGFLGVGLLVVANYLLLKKLSQPFVCPI